jgi:hypothetical protein
MGNLGPVALGLASRARAATSPRSEREGELTRLAAREVRMNLI